MNARLIHLKIKIRSLAAEARIIRTEERRQLRRREPDITIYRGLRDHRKRDVGGAARVALLAYALLRDVPYERCERSAVAPPDWAEVCKTAVRFGADDAAAAAWVDDACRASSQRDQPAGAGQPALPGHGFAAPAEFPTGTPQDRSTSTVA